MSESQVTQEEVVPSSTESEGTEQTPEAKAPELTNQLDLEAYFTKSYAEREQQQEAQEGEEPAEDAPEGEEAEESEAQESSGQEEEAEAEPDENSSLSKSEKRYKDLIDKLKAQTAKVEQLEKQVKSAKADTGSNNVYDVIREAADPQDLSSIEQQAREIQSWARRNLHKEYVEYDGKEIPHDVVVEKLEVAEDILNNAIPQRIQLLRQRQAADAQAEQVFEGWKNPESEEGQFYATVMNSPDFNKPLSDMPNSKMLLGFLYRGYRDWMAEQSGNSGKSTDKGRPQQEQVQTPVQQPRAQAQQPQQPQRQPAQNLPGMRQGAVPSKIQPSDGQNRERLKQDVLSRGALSADELEDYFNRTA